jgi:hypothetical protein
MKLVYIAGAYTGATFWDVESNIRASKEVALELGRRKIGFLSPVIHTAHFETYLGDTDPGYSFWLAMTSEMLKRCDAIFMVPNWIYSRGAIAEQEYALAHGIPDFASYDELEEWYRS